MPHTLTPTERKTLKARAHDLDPVVLVGDAGLTPGVLAEVDRALGAHELIKVRVAGDDRDARLAMRDRIVAELGAEPVQSIGKLLVLYRQKPIDELPVQAPAMRKSAAARKRPPGAKAFGRELSTRKVTTADRPPRTARIRKSGQRSTKKAFQAR